MMQRIVVCAAFATATAGAVLGVLPARASTTASVADKPTVSNAGQSAAVRVIARDYALTAPDSVRAGSVRFEFENQGTRDHELLIGLLRPGTTAADIIAAHQRGVGFRQLPTAYLENAVSGMLFAAPGTRSPATLIVPLISGRAYVLLCQLRDSIGAPSHAVLGMFHLIHAR